MCLAADALVTPINDSLVDIDVLAINDFHGRLEADFEGQVVITYGDVPLLRAADIMSDVQLHRYNAATLEQMHASLVRWAAQVSTAQRRVQPWLVTVALRDVADPVERDALGKVTTSFDLKPEEVDALVAAGRALLRDNPEFRQFLRALDAAPGT